MAGKPTRVPAGGEGIAGDDRLELRHSADVAGDEGVDRLGLLALVLEQLADTLLVSVLPGDDAGVALHGPLEDPEDVDPTAELVGHRLEREGDDRLVWIAFELDVGALCILHDGCGCDVWRRSQREKIEQAVDADKVGGGAGGYREDLRLGDGRRERRLELLGRDLLLGEELLEEPVVGLGDGLDKLLASLRCGIGEIGRYLVLRRLVAVVDEGLHREQIDDTLQLVLAADRHLDGDHLRPEGLAQGGDSGAEVGPLAVEHVAEQDARQAEIRGPAPQTLRLDLDAQHRVDDDERRLDDAQRGDGVGEEARVAGRVDEVEGETVALDVRKPGRHAELATLLVVVVVGDGRAVHHTAQAVDHAGLVQETLEQRGLAGTAVADERDVPDLAWVLHPGSPRVSSRRQPTHVRTYVLRVRSEGWILAQRPRFTPSRRPPDAGIRAPVHPQPK